MTTARWRAVRALLDRADAVDDLAGGAQAFDRARGIAFSDDQHHPDAAVEDAMHLRVGDLALRLQPAEERRQRPSTLRDRRAHAVRQDARMFSTSPPPVMCAAP